jgi:hypothetical protein
VCGGADCIGARSEWGVGCVRAWDFRGVGLCSHGIV